MVAGAAAGVAGAAAGAALQPLVQVLHGAGVVQVLHGAGVEQVLQVVLQVRTFLQQRTLGCLQQQRASADEAMVNTTAITVNRLNARIILDSLDNHGRPTM